MRPSCTKVKVQVDLMANIPKYMEIMVVNSATMESRVGKVRIKYDFLSKYCKQCKLQGHEEQECRTLHPELKVDMENVSRYKEKESKSVKEYEGMKGIQ